MQTNMKDDTIQSDLPCPLTNTRESQVICERDRHGNPLRTIINVNSGLVYTAPRPKHQVIKKFYKEEYRQEYKGSQTPKLKHVYRAGKVALSRWEKIKNQIQGCNRILDAGAGGGELMYLLKQKHHEVHGIEPNRGYAEYAKAEYDLNLELGFFEEVQLEPASFDVILLFHVLEHLDNPINDLKKLCRFLKPGGLFIIEVPNVTYSNGYPTAKWHIGHLFNFNTCTLSATAGKANLWQGSVREDGDGGNIIGFFKKQENQNIVKLEGNYQIVREALRSHTLARHLLSLNPYLRPLKKIIRAIREKFAIRSHHRGRDILNALYGSN